MNIASLTGRFTSVTFTYISAQTAIVKIKSTKTGNANIMFVSDDVEWDRRRLAWVFTYKPNVKPSEFIGINSIAQWAHQTYCSIQEQAFAEAHDLMREQYGWGNPADIDPWDVDEDWQEEYYSRYQPLRAQVTERLVNEIRAAA